MSNFDEILASQRDFITLLKTLKDVGSAALKWKFCRQNTLKQEILKIEIFSQSLKIIKELTRLIL